MLASDLTLSNIWNISLKLSTFSCVKLLANLPLYLQSLYCLRTRQSLTPSICYRWCTSHKFRYTHCTWERNFGKKYIFIFILGGFLENFLTCQCSLLLGLFCSFWWLIAKGLPCGRRQNTKWSWRSLLCLYAEDLDKRELLGTKGK